MNPISFNPAPRRRMVAEKDQSLIFVEGGKHEEDMEKT